MPDPRLRGLRRRLERAWEGLDRVAERRRRLLLAGALVLLLAPLVLGAVLLTGEARLSAYGHEWDDVGATRDAVRGLGYDTGNVMLSPLALRGVEDPDRTLLVVAGAERRYTPAEADALEAYVHRGGRLLLADDTGFANSVAVRFGVQFERTPLLDEEFSEARAFVRATATLEGANYTLIFNEPSSLSNASAGAGTVLARSSDRSYQDNNANGEVDLDDAPGPFPMIVAVDAGRGRVVLLADPSLLIDEMSSLGDNREFVKDLTVHLLPEGGTILFDESRHARGVGSGGLSVAGAVAGLTMSPVPFLVLAVGTLVVAGVATRLLEDEPSWQHRFLPRAAPSAPSGDEAAERLHDLAIETVARDLDVEPRELVQMSEQELAGRLNDGALAGFLKAGKESLSSHELSEVRERLRRFLG